MPAASSSRAVPPVEISSTPIAARPRANSRISVLSATESSARLIRSGLAGAAGSGTPTSTVSLIALDPHQSWVCVVDPDPSGGDQLDRSWQQLVLDPVHLRLELLDRPSVCQLD